MCYTDPPANGLFCDLDLFIKTPSGTILFGNNISSREEHQFSTSEKITVKKSDLEEGKYELHVLSSEFGIYETLEYSLILSADIDFNKIKMTPETKCIQSCSHKGKCIEGVCQCIEDRSGRFCQQLVPFLKQRNEVIMSYQHVQYFRYISKSRIKKVALSIKGLYSDITYSACISEGSYATPISSPEWVCTSRISPLSNITITTLAESTRQFFIAIHSTLDKSHEIKVLSEIIEDHTLGLVDILAICFIILVSVALVFIQAFCYCLKDEYEESADHTDV